MTLKRERRTKQPRIKNPRQEPLDTPADSTDLKDYKIRHITRRDILKEVNFVVMGGITCIYTGIFITIVQNDLSIYLIPILGLCLAFTVYMDWQNARLGACRKAIRGIGTSRLPYPVFPYHCYPLPADLMKFFISQLDIKNDIDNRVEKSCTVDSLLYALLQPRGCASLNKELHQIETRLRNTIDTYLVRNKVYHKVLEEHARTVRIKSRSNRK